MLKTELTDSVMPVGESVRLREVRESDFDIWASWFNRVSVTRFLPQGLFPNSVMDQKTWFDRARESERLVAMVESIEGSNLIGVCSISEIDWRSGTGQVSSVVPLKPFPHSMPGLEARALITQHAIQTMGLRRLWAGQVFPANLNWTISQSLIGWMVEGFTIQGFQKSNASSDTIRTSVVANDIKRLIAARNETLWPGLGAIREMLDSDEVRLYAERLQELHRLVCEARATVHPAGERWT